MSQRRVWITGAAGFIGRHLASHLAISGDRVVGVGHGVWPDASDWGISRWLNGDVSAANLSQLARDEGRPDVLYHLAGGSSVGAAISAPREDFRRTVDATSGLLDWLRLESPETAVLIVSSAAVYGAGHDSPIREDAPTRPYSPYGYHKLMTEQLCRSYGDTYGLSFAIARLFSVYGPGLRKQLLWDACGRLASGAPVLRLGGTGRELRDWTEVRDVVRAIKLMSGMASPSVPTVNVGSGVGVDVATIAGLVTAGWGTSVTVDFNGECRPGDPESLVADGGRLAGLGFEWTVSAEEGIRNYVEWRKKLS